MTLTITIKADKIDYMDRVLKTFIKEINNQELMEHYKKKHGCYWMQGILDRNNEYRMDIDLLDSSTKTIGHE